MLTVHGDKQVVYIFTGLMELSFFSIVKGQFVLNGFRLHFCFHARN